MVGSSDSIACANVMINSSVAESLRQFADALEAAEDFGACLHDLIRDTIRAHKRIIFNGNGYDDAWIREAVEERGLMNLRTTPDALRMLCAPKNIEMLTRHGVYTESELRSRYEIQLENYVRTVRIEALTMVDMTRKDILPAVMGYCAALTDSIEKKKTVGTGISFGYESRLAGKLSGLADRIDEKVTVLDGAVKTLDGLDDYVAAADFTRDEIIPKMAELRAGCDEAETLTAAEYWPFPTYGDLLFGV
jgi:glutamine synthetase